MTTDNNKFQEGQATVGKEEKEMAMQTELKIEGMMCAHCQKHVNDALLKMDGVTAVEVNLEAGTAKVTAEREIPQAEFAQVITDAGYELVGLV
jgi:Cu+-exporting ATPase